MISEFVEYVKQVWKNKPNVNSPLNADRLNHMEDGIENNSKKIKETVTAVNELTENSAYTPLTLLGTVDGIKLYYSRYGKDVMVKGEGNFSKAETITSSAQLKLGTLPVGSRPSTTLFYPINYLYTNATNLTLMLTNTGEVSICTTSGDISITNGKYFNFAVGFIL